MDKLRVEGCGYVSEVGTNMIEISVLIDVFYSLEERMFCITRYGNISTALDPESCILNLES